MKIIIKNGRVLDPNHSLDEIGNIWISDRVIVEEGCFDEKAADHVIDAKGCWVLPGLIDLHVHLREPGYEHKGTIYTESRACVRGGFTTICPMPNTAPPTDSPHRIQHVLEISKKDAVVNILPVGAVTIGQLGDEKTDIKGMAEAGAVAISEDGKSVMNTYVYQNAMKEAKENGLLVMAHCEDRYLVGNGVLNEGDKANELGVKGISNAVEDVIAARDILLSKETGAKLHLCHCSTKDSVSMVRFAKQDGLLVTAEVCPHHFTLTQDDIIGRDTNYKMNPPLRSKEDVKALKEGLRDGTIDVIATDHAPHHADEKARTLEEAPFGIIGAETAVSLAITELVDTGILTPLMLVEKMSSNPARILGINKGSLAIGSIADVTIIDPTREYTIDVNTFVSKGKNTPFHGRKVHGMVLYTIVDGTIVFDEKNGVKQ